MNITHHPCCCPAINCISTWPVTAASHSNPISRIEINFFRLINNNSCFGNKLKRDDGWRGLSCYGRRLRAEIGRPPRGSCVILPTSTRALACLLSFPWRLRWTLLSANARRRRRLSTDQPTDRRGECEAQQKQSRRGWHACGLQMQWYQKYYK